jgi:hypothetical protein
VRSRWLVYCASAVFLSAAAYMVWWQFGVLLHSPHSEGDTGVLIRGAAAANACLDRHILVKCPWWVWHFPLLQYIPSVLILRTWGNPELIFRFLCYASFTCFCATLGLTFAFLRSRGGRLTAIAAVAALIGSYYLQYATTSFGEVVAGFLALAFTAASLWRRSAILIFVLLVLTGITKEIAVPFLLVIGVTPLLVRFERPILPWLRRDLRSLIAIALGAAVALTANGLFNIFRFGTVTNTYLLQEWLFVPTLKQQALFFAALFFSPNGGLVEFAPVYVTLYTVVVVGVVRALRRRELSVQQALPGLASVGLLLICQLGLSRWLSPFGWWAWGPRLTMPWLPALLLLALAPHADIAERALRALAARPWRLAVVTLLFAVLAVPHVAFEYARDGMGVFFDANPDCPSPNVMPEKFPDVYYGCHNGLSWPRQYWLLQKVYLRVLQPDARVPCLVFLVAFCGFGFWLARAARKAGQGVPQEAP